MRFAWSSFPPDENEMMPSQKAYSAHSLVKLLECRISGTEKLSKPVEMGRLYTKAIRLSIAGSCETMLKILQNFEGRLTQFTCLVIFEVCNRHSKRAVSSVG